MTETEVALRHNHHIGNTVQQVMTVIISVELLLTNRTKTMRSQSRMWE